MVSAVSAVIEEEIFQKVPKPAGYVTPQFVAEDKDLLEFGLDFKGFVELGTQGSFKEVTPVTDEEVAAAKPFMVQYAQNQVTLTPNGCQLALEELWKSRAYIATGWAKFLLSNDPTNDPTYWKADAWCVVGSMARAAYSMSMAWDYASWALTHDACVAQSRVSSNDRPALISAYAMLSVARAAGVETITAWNDTRAEQADVIHGFDVAAALIRQLAPAVMPDAEFAEQDAKGIAAI